MSESTHRFLYNPRRATHAELAQTIIGRRKRVLSDLVGHLERHANAKSQQHLLLIGPRGSGKTHLLTLLNHTIRSTKLSRQWRPIQLPEEVWEVAGLRDLLIAAFEAFDRAPIDEVDALPEHLQPRKALEQIRGESDLSKAGELGFAILRELAQVTGRRTVLMVENLDAILDEQFDDKLGMKRLRDELMTQNHLLLIATSPGKVTAVDDHSLPLFSLLKKIYLDDFSLDELEELMRERAKLEAAADPGARAEMFLDRLDGDIHRLKALLFLTGGNPRTALMLYQVAVHEQFDQARLSLEALLDDLTTYFQGRLKSLPAQERRVVVALAKSGRAMRPSEIAKAVGVSASQASAVIGRLVDRGHLRLAEQAEGKSRYYVLREVLFRYWREWRNSEHDFSLFVDFMAAWFKREELESWLEHHNGPDRSGPETQWEKTVRDAIASQHDVYDRLNLHQTSITRSTSSDTATTISGSDSASSDPLVRRLLDKFSVPKSSLAGRLESAATEGDFRAADRHAEELIEALEKGEVETNYEIGSLARLIVLQRGDGPVSAAEAVARRRVSHAETEYLRSIAFWRANRNDVARAGLEQLVEGFVEDNDTLAAASAAYNLARVQQFLHDLDSSAESLHQAIELYRKEKSRLGEANCLSSLGDLKVRTADLVGARANFDAALPIYRAIHDQVGEANCVRSLGDLKFRTDDLDGARADFDAALPIYRAIHERLGEANCLSSLGGLKFHTDDLDGARADHDAALPIFRAIHERVGEANCLRSLGDLKVRIADLDGARADYDAALPIYRETHERLGEANCLISLGNLKVRIADLDGARADYDAALPIYREIHDRLGQANCLRSLGNLKVRTDDLDGARADYDAALLIYRETHARLGEANCLRSLGDLKFRTDDLEGARADYDAALPICRETHARLDEANCLRSLGDLKVRTADLDGARADYDAVLLIYRETHSRLGEANCLISLGDLKFRTADLDGARADYDAALPIYRETHDRLGEANCLRSLGLVVLQQGQPTDAFRHIRDALEIVQQISHRLGEQAAWGNLARCALAVQSIDHAVLLSERALELGRTLQDKWGQSISLESQLQCFGQQQNSAGLLPTVFVLRDLYNLMSDPIQQKRLDDMAEELTEGVSEDRRTELEQRAERLRHEAVQAVAERFYESGVNLLDMPRPALQIAFQEKLRQYGDEVELLKRLSQAIAVEPVKSVGDTEFVQTSIALLEHDDLQDIAAAIVSHGLLECLVNGTPDAALEWIDFIEVQLSDEKRGLWNPFRIASRHLRAVKDKERFKEDIRILDRQAPEVRAAVVGILNEIERRQTVQQEAENEEPPQD